MKRIEKEWIANYTISPELLKKLIQDKLQRAKEAKEKEKTK